MRIIVGLQYAGLSNVVFFAQRNEVIGIDISKARVDAVNSRQAATIDAEHARSHFGGRKRKSQRYVG